MSTLEGRELQAGAVPVRAARGRRGLGGDPARPERVTVADLHQRMRAQGVAGREHIAFVCVTCGTVQSIASLMLAGASAELAERYVGFSCEGRLTGAGPYRRGKKSKGRGCDWTLGGLFTVHRLEVVDEHGRVHPSFELASQERAQALQANVLAQRTAAASTGGVQ